MTKPMQWGFEWKHILRATVIASILLLDAKFDIYTIFPQFQVIFPIGTLIIILTWFVWKMTKNQSAPKTPLTSPLIILIGIASFATLFSVDQRGSVGDLFDLIALILIFFLICDLLLIGWKPKTLEIGFLLFVSCLLFLGLKTIIEWYWSWYMIRVPEYPVFLLRFRLYGITFHPNAFAMLINLALPFAIIRLARGKSKFSQLFWILWLIIATIVFYFVNSRGGMLSTLVMLSIITYWLLPDKRIPSSSNLLNWIQINKKIFSSVFAYLAIFFSFGIAFKFISPFTGTLNHGTSISAGRITFWTTALKMIQRNPFIGTGLGTYPRFYLEMHPPGIEGWVAGHAHNLFLEITSQMGILGLIILIWICFSTIKSILFSKPSQELFRNNRHSTPKDYIICSVAALSGFLIHSIFDYLLIRIHTAVPVFIIIAIGFASANLIIQGPKLKWKKSFGAIVIIIVLLFSATIFKQAVAHNAQFNSILASNSGSWNRAVEYLSFAMENDSQLNYYNEQRGYALGVLAEGENIQGSDNEAIEDLTRAMKSQPFWAPNYVNLSALLDRRGESENSFKTLQSLPQEWFDVWPLPAIILGEKYLDYRDNKMASKLFTQALERDLGVGEMAICNSIPLCKRIATEIVLEDEIYNIHLQAMEYIENGKPENSLELLGEFSNNEIPRLFWIDRAAAHIALHQYDLAHYELNIANEIGPMRNEVIRSYYSLVLSDLLIARNESQAAIPILENVVKPQMVFRYYDSYIFHRVGFPDPLLPSVRKLNQNYFDLKIYNRLHELYLSQNRLPEANWAKEQENLLLKYFPKNN